MAAWSSELSDMPLIAIMRAPNARHFVEASFALVEAGFRYFEFTLTSEGALEALREARGIFSSEVHLGVGSVRTPAQVEAAYNAGGEYIFSQYGSQEVVLSADLLKMPIIPGALTPTEVARVWSWGVEAVKVSPVGTLGGPSYLRELSSPMPEIPMIPTGGVRLEDVTAYLSEGSMAVGLSSHLFGKFLHNGEGISEVKERGQYVVSQVREYQSRQAANSAF